MFTDPKLLIAGVCLVVISLLLALVLRQVRRNRHEEEVSEALPRMAAAGFVESEHAREMAGSDAVARMAAIAVHKPSYVGAPPPVAVEANGRKVIAIIHDFGHPRDFPTDERRYLSTREAFEILAEIRAVPHDKPIDVVLHTPGGEAFACELIAGALKDRPNTTAYVPYCAMSAGTIVALSTEKIVMGKYACLGPIDTQFYGFPIESYIRLLKEKPMGSIDDFTVLLGYLAEKEMKTARARACELLNKSHFGKDDACQISDFLVAGDMPHSEQISRERAIQIGVNITNGDCPTAVYDLVEERLKIFRSMDDHDGIGGPDFGAKADGADRPQDRRITKASPPVMWRKP